MSDRKDRVFMAVAHTISELGTCDRARAGAVLTLEGRCISWGYNGAAPGMPHCDKNYHGWYMNKELLETYGCRNAIHAEANTLAAAARQGISTEGGTLFVTISPCIVCAHLIIAAGITRVLWTTPYRDSAGAEALTRADIETGVILPA